jgi:hypothetical protein
MPYFECNVCCYGTTSPRHADDHADDTGHRITEYEDDE